MRISKDCRAFGFENGHRSVRIGRVGIIVLLLEDEFSKLLRAGGGPFGGMKFSPCSGRLK